MNKKDKPFKHIVIVGCGDIGQRVAKIWKNAGKLVFGLSRNKELLSYLRQQHIHAIQIDLEQAETLAELSGRLSQQALIYYFAPPPTKGVEDTRITNFLSALQIEHLPSQIIYISTSGVYGDQQGQLINEDAPVKPQVDRAKRRYDAEEQLRQWCELTNVSLTVLRVGGIYGPNRLPLQRLKDGIPMLHENLSPHTNRIHADDLAQVCVAAAKEVAFGKIYNVSDGTDSNMTAYFNTIADFTQLPRPPLVDWDEAEQTISKGMLSYLKESRRMDNTKMMKELGVTLLYPTLEEGLKACELNLKDNSDL
ncbi:MAG: SDR family oxidoreductase [Woeseiaceae bacterium]